MANMAKTTLKVEGMTCGACTSAVEGGFKGVAGVANIEVSLVMSRAVVEHDPDVITPQACADLCEDLGFDSEVIKTDKAAPATNGPVISTTTLKVEGMTCGACTSAVEGGFKNVSGIKGITISLITERAVVEHDAATISPSTVASLIDDIGFDATVLDTKVSDDSGPAAKATGSSQVLTTTTVSIEGMTCGACTSAVEGGFKNLEGLVQFSISLLAERAIIVHEPLKLSAEAIVERVEDSGFDCAIISSQQGVLERSSDTATLSFKIYGLRDLDSASTLEESLKQISGVKDCSVQFASTRATVTHNPSEVGIRAIVEAIEGLGFNALLAESEDNSAQLESLAKTREIQGWKRDFQISLAFAIPVFLISMIFPMYIPALDFGSWQMIPGLWFGDVVCLILTIPVQFGVGKRFYISAFKSLRHGSPTMDVLVVLGTSAAFFFSCIAMLVSLFDPQHTRPATVFDTSGMLLTFITLGRFLENRAKGQTSKALSRLMSLAPSMATIYADPIAAEKAGEEWDAAPSTPVEKKEKSGEPSNSSATEEKVIPTELLQLGDICILRPGDKVPADGLVMRGQSYIDESMVTGEAMPIIKKGGSQLMAGTVNGAGRLDFRVARAGSDTQLSQIVKLVQEAQTSRAPIQRMADLVAGYFVPTIISLGLITFVFWMVVSHVLPNPPAVFLEPESGGRFMVCLKLCISVIVFACPCALGLSTPTAVMVGTGVGAANGILFKGGAALETATRINHVVFDKTGTLTFGKMDVANTSIENLWKSNDWRRRLWWTVVGLAEMSSEHPIGKAIVLRAKEELGLGSEDMIDGSVGDFEAVVGKGIAVTVEPASSTERQRHRVMIGNPDFLSSEGITVPTSLQPQTPLRSPFPRTPRTPQLPKTPSMPPKTVNAGTTDIHIAIDGAYTGMLQLSDTVKPSARAAVLALRQMGITASLVTGDQLPTALAIAALVDIPTEDVFAGISPDNKQAIVKQIQDSAPDAVVAMVGDGINDSPALATADVGIALSSGTDVAMEAADVVLMRPDDLLNVPAALSLSRTIFRRIKLNLGWACMYNLIGLPFAMGLGLALPGHFMLPPMAAGAAMACSSVSVVGSSLLLKFWSRPSWMTVERIEQGAGFGGASGPRRAAIEEAAGSAWRRVQSLWSQAAQRGATGGRGDYVPLTPVADGAVRRMSYGDV